MKNNAKINVKSNDKRQRRKNTVKKILSKITVNIYCPKTTSVNTFKKQRQKTALQTIVKNNVKK